MATRAQKFNYRYSDYYCYMSLADFIDYISQEDNDDRSFTISSKGDSD
jgi:hypothetical protein